MSNRSIFYCHGYAATPIIEACHRHGLFKLLNVREFRERTWLIQNLQANAGPFTIALEALGRIGWIEKKSDAYRLTKKASLRHLDGLMSLYAIDPHQLLTQPSHAGILKEKIEQVFLRSDDAARSFSLAPAQGAIIVPLVLCLRALDAENFAAELKRFDPALSGAIGDLFARQQWFTEDQTQLTASGRTLLQDSLFDIAASYRPLLCAANDLLFGDPTGVILKVRNRKPFNAAELLPRMDFNAQPAENSWRELIEIFNSEPWQRRHYAVVNANRNDGTVFKQISLAPDLLADVGETAPNAELAVLHADQPVHYVDQHGRLIDALSVLSSRQESLRGLAQTLGESRLLALETHAVPFHPGDPQRADCDVLHLDWIHRLAGEYSITAEAFITLAASVGLLNDHYVNRYPRTSAPCQLSLHAFIKRDYVVRHATEGDLERLYQLEEACWQHTRTPKEQIRSRLQRYPQGQFVLEKEGRVLGVIYSQRIESVDALFAVCAADVHKLHNAAGCIIQLLAVNIDPQAQDARYGDQLLEFMLQRCGLIPNVNKVVGVTLCRDYNSAGIQSFDEYIRQSGVNQDPILAFHEAHGAKIIQAVPGYRPEDHANLSNGVLVEYDILNRTPRQPRIKRDGKVTIDIQAPLATMSRDEIIEFVQEGIAQFLGLSRNELDIDRPLMEMGLDSADLLMLQQRYEEKFCAELQAGFFFENNSIRKIINHWTAQSGIATESGGASPVMQPNQPVPLFRANKPSINRGCTKDIAIVGMSCKLPGGIETPGQLWQVLVEQKCVVGPFPRARCKWPSDNPGIVQGGFMKDVDAFDAQFFRISPAEARRMDPQQRILLELAWSCLEDAGIVSVNLKGTNTGVFIAASNCDYSRLIQEAGLEVQAHQGIASSLAVLANRLSYFFDLCGPSLAIDTACSASLVALHEAIQSLRSGECPTALVGGINVICHPDLSLAYYRAGMLAHDGKCKVFDAKANGYVRAEGAVMLLLKPLNAAVASGDQIHAVIKGTAINHGGLSGGLTVPNPHKQSELLQTAWKDAEVHAQDMTYIEAHGTGTPLGDPIEIEALQTAYSAAGPVPDGKKCGIGSIKSNLGHLEPAAGLAGLLKVVLSLKNRQLPASINYDELNPKIHLKDTPFYIQDECRPWDVDKPRTAGVSSFGSGGANGHVVVQEYAGEDKKSHRANHSHLFVASAPTRDRLQTYIEKVIHWLQEESIEVDFGDAIYTWQVGRTAFRERLAIRVKDREELLDKLEQWLAGDNRVPELWSGHGNQDSIVNRIWRTKSAERLIDQTLAEGDLEQLAIIWTAGVDFDWRKLYEGTLRERRRPVSLPTYAFARERYWIDTEEGGRLRGDVPAAALDPLLHLAAKPHTTEALDSCDGTSYLYKWEPQPQVKQNLPVSHKNVVVVCSSPFCQLDTTIIEHYHQQNTKTVLIRMAHASKQLAEGEWCCDIQDPEGFHKCLPAEEVDAVYFLAMGGKPSSIAWTELTESREANEIQLLRLVKCLKRRSNAKAKIDFYILTLKSHSLDHSESAFLGSGVIGLGYSLAQGDSRYRVRSLDLSLEDLQSPQDRKNTFAAIINEPPSNRGEAYKLHSGHRYRQTFFDLQWDKSQPPAIRHSGAFLLVGGAGTVGQIITRNLITKYGATVIWIGRSAESSEKVQRALKSLDGMRTSVHYLQADVTSLDSMQNAVRLIKEKGIELNGAIFSAMAEARGHSIEQISEDDFRGTFDTRALGSWVFYTALQNERMDFMCYFSSRQAYALLGASKHPAYVCGTTFLDAWVRSIAITSAFPVGTINWGVWKSAAQRSPQGITADGLDGFSDEEGFEHFERFVSELQRRRTYQTLCVGESRLLESVMNRNVSEFMVLTQAPLPISRPLPEDEIRVAEERIAKVRNKSVRDELEQWSIRLLFQQVRSMVERTGQRWPISLPDIKGRLAILGKYAPWWNETIKVLCQNKYLELEDGVVRVGSAAVATGEGEQAQREKFSEDPGVRALATLLSECLEKLPDVLQGRILATDLIFPHSSIEKVEGIYRNDALYETFNEMVANAVLAYCKQRLHSDSRARLKILEIGAGTGGTSSAVFAKLGPFQQSIEEYCYTDLSKAFFFHAEKHYVPEYPYVRCQRLDIERAIVDQGFDLGGYDLVIAANVLHATKNIRHTLRNAKGLLRGGGFLILNEISAKAIWAHLTFGLLDGWWRFEDADLRIPNCPALLPCQWQQVLQEEGLHPVQFPAKEAHDLGYQIILAQSDGVVRQGKQGADIQLLSATAQTAPTQRKPKRGVAPPPASAPSEEWYVKTAILECLVSTLKTSPENIDDHVAFLDYGLDSLLGGEFINQVNRRLSINLNTVVIFEHPSLYRLCKYVREVHGEQIEIRNHEQMASRVPAAETRAPSIPEVSPQGFEVASSRRLTSMYRSADTDTRNHPVSKTPEIAVIGMSGMFPKAANVHEFWRNLVEGKDAVEELPAGYLNQREYFSTEKKPGKTCCKWGGILTDRDCFDPLFFRIAPREAESMNPHQRLVLQEGWRAIEDAGYNPKLLSGSQTGIFIGAEPTGYLGETFTGYSDAIIASRLAYVLNLCGPAFVVNTGCSSSGVAIHLACESLRNGETDLALAGGVNACMEQRMLISLDDIGMLSPSGRCHTFDIAADGTIISEAVAVVVLKRLDDAVRDGDFIYGVICGSGTNQDGASNGITAPNGVAQEQLIDKVYKKFGIDPEKISYVEAHGTGTKLGDPVEVNALVRAFRKFTAKTGYCAVGSVKTHIGHTSAASGVTGLIKVLLSLQNEKLPGQLHFKELNPLIELAESPFYICAQESAWNRYTEFPRMAALNSFGHSGSNSHLVIREYVESVEDRAVDNLWTGGPMLVPLSAATKDQLRQKAVDLLGFIRAAEKGPTRPGLDLSQLTYTLQVGREAMEQRLGLLAGSLAELSEKLELYVKGEAKIADLYHGQAKAREHLSILSQYEDVKETLVANCIAGHKYNQLLDLWVQGLEVDWSKLWGEQKPRRIGLPGYPFARERYWIEAEAGGSRGGAVLHPLLHRSTSDLGQQRFSSVFTGDEFFLADHRVNVDGNGEQRVLPGVAYLEMARAAIEQAWPERPPSSILELLNTVWVQPFVVTQNQQISIELAPNENGIIDYKVYGQEQELERVYCQGGAVWSREDGPAKLDIDQLKSRMVQGQVEGKSIYRACAGMGLIYGRSFKTISTLLRGQREILAYLRLPQEVEKRWEYVLHPSIMDGALQACIGLIEDESEERKRPPLPFALERLRVITPCTQDMVAWVRYAPESQAEDNGFKFDIDLCDEHGNVCVQMRGFSTRVVSQKADEFSLQDQVIGSLLARPVWEESRAETYAGPIQEYVEHYVILCELEQVGVEELGSMLPQSQCLALRAREPKDTAGRYSEHARECFERIQTILRAKRGGKALVQIVVVNQGEHALFAGLSGLLKTAALENPRIVGQLILVPSDMTAERLCQQLQVEKNSRVQPLVKYEQGVRQALHWREVPVEGEEARVAFREQGVYLITGGLGGLGILFAKEILHQTRQGRVILIGRSPLSGDKQALLEGLSAEAGRVSYRQVDVGDQNQVKQLMAAIQEEYGQLHGILHTAGIIADNFIVKKTSEEFSLVLEPKVRGTCNLDEASRDVELDFFVLFSSIAGAIGNLGQADYAVANGFLDQFARHRNEMVRAKQRHGRTQAINWGLWQAGGMRIDSAMHELLEQSTGMHAMQTLAGMETFYRSLALPEDQILALEGNLSTMRRALLSGLAAPAEAAADPAVMVADIGESLAEKTEKYLRKQLSGLLKLSSHRIDPQSAFEQYGIDSILAVKLVNQLEKTFGSLSKTLLFEYRTIAELSRYFVAHHGKALTALFEMTSKSTAAMPSAPSLPLAQPKSIPNRRFGPPLSAAVANTTNNKDRANNKDEAEGIAIIGMSGRYPQAVNVEAYWENLRQGKDCIEEVPKERWDWREYYSEDRTQSGHHFSKWGGFIEGVDEFDPLFFNISPREAKMMDPQERIFLQHAWMAMEDAGYTRGNLQAGWEEEQGGEAGVYVGVMYSEYQLFGAEAGVRGQRVGIAGSVASIANRVSYALNLHGPSVTLDTMCSSSLSAIHFACQDLKQGRTSVGIAGGVNVSLHPNKYLALSAGQFISSAGQCQSFGEGGDGYIPGEGVGVVVLKRLGEAERDGDHIYGIIRGSALNHGGKTNGYTVPNPQAQASAIRRALKRAKLEGGEVSYIEAHGTGTKLGDPIEIAGLNQGMGKWRQERGKCLIGSAKSNIGHCEAAAGIAGLTKVLLQMEHGQIVASLHSEKLNPLIDFKQSRFEVNQELRAWETPVVEGKKLPRIAGISSFGAGGSNAHMIVEEYGGRERRGVKSGGEVVILLSARTAGQLRQKAVELLEFVGRRRSGIDLVAMAYTLQVGREAMEERLGVKVKSLEELEEKLTAYVRGEEEIEEVYQGQVKGNKEVLSLFHSDGDLKQTVEQWVVKRKYSKLLEMWVKGLEVDWSKLYGESKPERMSLPTYPFARERYWMDIDRKIDRKVGAQNAGNGVAAPVLHPLLHRNTSDLRQQRYNSIFTGDEFFLRDHQVAIDDQGVKKVLPAAATLEMARAAVEQAWPAPSESKALELRNVVWAQPLVVSESKQVNIALLANDHDQIDFEIYSPAGDEEIVHCQGHAVWSGQTASSNLDLAQLRASGETLARLQLPNGAENTLREYVLHPYLLEEALQAAFGSLDGGSERSKQPRVPLALDCLRVMSRCHREMYVWVRYAREGETGNKVVKLDIDLCDERGNTCVQMRGVRWHSASLDIGERGTDQMVDHALPAEYKEINAAAPVYKELAFSASPQATSTQEAQNQLTSRLRPFITLSKPGPGLPEPVRTSTALAVSDRALVAHESVSFQRIMPRPRPVIALSQRGPGFPVQGSTAPAVSPVKLYDDGHGTFSIQITAPGSIQPQTKDLIAQLMQALETVRQQKSVKVLMLSGLEQCFRSGKREDYNEAIEQELYQVLVTFPHPVTALLQGDVTGAALLAASLCDLMVGNEDAIYSYTDVKGHFYPTTAEAMLLTERFGAVQTQDLLFLTTSMTGKQLRSRGWTFPMLPKEQVGAYGQKLAAAVAAKSQGALRLLKQHSMRQLARLVKELKLVEIVASTTENPQHTIVQTMASSSGNICVEVPAQNVVFIQFRVDGKAADEKVKALVVELRVIFAELQRRGGYKAVVLASEYPDFLPGIDPSVEEEVVLEFQRLITELEIPVIVALDGNAQGHGWLISQFCDACVYSETGLYSTASMGQSGLMAQKAAVLFGHRLGHAAGKEVLLTEAAYSGVDLQQRVGALLVVEQKRVVSAALKVAESWSSLPLATLVEWKKHTVATLQEEIGSLEAIAEWKEKDESDEGLPGESTSIRLQSKAVTATAHVDGIVVVKMEDRETKNMFSDALSEGMKEVFAHIEQTPKYKVVVLTGYESYFASGGTKEGLLAIHAGKAKFTDNKMFQVALDCKLPVLAALQGNCVGAGWTLGMFADIALLSEESRYVSPYMNYGFTPGAGATWVLRETLGPDVAQESLLTAEPCSGRELKSRGVRVRVLPRAEVYDASIALARQIAQRPRGRLLWLKQHFAAYMHPELEVTTQLELEMHEKSFVGQAEVLLQIQKNFYREIIAPSDEAESIAVQVEQPTPSVENDALPSISATLKTLLANELQMTADDIDEDIQFADLGLDSITGVTWVRKINERYHTSIEATKVYSYPTLRRLSRYVEQEAQNNGKLSLQDVPATSGVRRAIENTYTAPNQSTTKLAVERLSSWRGRTASRFISSAAALPHSPASLAIAVIGMAGQFPQARNVEEFWQNLAQGRNCISLIPGDRWDVKTFYQSGKVVAGKSNSQWMGALEDYDRFDPLFFNISPTEAESMDPQQRLFLQACWQSIEDAGYDARVLSGSKCGVFVGCASGQYQQLARPQQLNAHGFTGNATSILAGRISYFLNLQGPNLAIDTACSSSLVALAQACDSLSWGSSDLALAGGVHVMAGPELHLMTSHAGMLSPEGRCYTFDQRADGFVPGEGVGVVVLKRLAEAERDGDMIYGVIEGWGVNQDGKTNGITAPNPESQTRLEQEVYDKYRIDPGNIQLIEAHGTGTKLGDPIEVEGLKKAFEKYTQKREYCALGSVKSNIGHCATAAGIAGFIKLMLALKRKQLPPTINFERLNEHIELQESPFYINDRLQEWELKGGERRQAAISSFGFSGTNAHMVIGEYQPPVEVKPPVSAVTQDGKIIIPLSAKTVVELKQKARDLRDWLRREAGYVDLIELAYTLQVGRESMEERVGLLASSVEQVMEKLEAYIEGKAEIKDFYQRQGKRNHEYVSLVSQDEEVKETIVDKWIAARKFSNLAALWVKGVDVDWKKLYGEIKPQRIHLPVYPFAKQRYWIKTVKPHYMASEEAPAGATNVLRARDLDSSYSALQAQEKSQPLFFQENWEESPTPALESPGNVQFIIFSDTELQDTITNSDETGHFKGACFVRQAESYQRTSASFYGCSPHDPDAISEIFNQVVTQKESNVPITVIYTWAKGQRDNGIHGLFDLFKAIKTSTHVVDHVILAGRYDPLCADTCWDYSWIGFERSLKQILPRTRISLLYTDSGSYRISELLDISQHGGEIWYKAGQRFVLSFKPSDLTQTSEEPALRRHGTYLITGGCGALGLRFANYLAENYQARLLLLGRSPLSSEIQKHLDALGRAGADEVRYYAVDVSDRLAMESWAKALPETISGVIHAAGVESHLLFCDKTASDINLVLHPKTLGTLILDEVLAHQPLDFVCYFSSMAALVGDFGACDYAVANRFQMAYALHRKAREEVKGKTAVINWPLWLEGGMGSDNAQRAQYLKMTAQEFGNEPLTTESGLDIWQDIMRSDQVQAAVMIGKPSQVQKYLHKVYYGRDQAKLPAATKNGFSSESAIGYEAYPTDCLPNSVRPENTTISSFAEQVTDSASASDSASFSELRNYLKTSLAERLGLKPTVIDGDQPFGEVGLDSFLGAEWVAAINEKYGTSLPNIVIYDYPCVNAMAQLLESELKKRRTSSTPKIADAIRSASSGSPLRSKVPNRNTSAWVGRTRRNDTRRHDSQTADKVAIIGMSGRYPQAANLDEYWDNLVHGRNSIVEVPRSRWDIDQYYDPDPESKGKTYSKWLGLMDDIDCFDPLFFRISPSEAVSMDPQQRLFLQESYRAFEDSGYSAGDLDKKKCGVYLGVSTSEYAWLLSRKNALSNNATGNSDAIAAARIAYHLNLRGPAIAVDTACSSSLVAIHLACQGLLNHETDMALAGGINLWFLPESFQGMSQAGMLSPDGQCKAFDDSANGIVVGDGVGAIVLKRLRDAEADNDHIYGVILGSAINQDGRTNGITAPSVNSQIELLRDVYTRHDINPETISYIETHGTGTKLGDPIELTALDTVFKEKSARRNYCALASVKTNIGHTGAAAGIASVHKVLLSLRNRTLVPSLNVTVENSRFDFKDSPFYINRDRKAWNADAEVLRRVGVSAFGYSGTNAHLVIEEYPAATESCATGTAYGDLGFIVPLSARTRGQLLQKARDLLEFLRGPGHDSESTEQRVGSRKAIDLSAVAYTLQVGREAMEERLGFVVKSVDQLLERLSAYVDGGNDMQGVYQGRAESDAGGMAIIGLDSEMREAVDRWIASRKFSRLLELWVRGLNFDWNKLYDSVKPRRISLPTYPFAKERYWIDEVGDGRSLDMQYEPDGKMKSIENVMNEIDDGTVETDYAVRVLKMLVSGNGNGAKLAYRK